MEENVVNVCATKELRLQISMVKYMLMSYKNKQNMWHEHGY